MSTYTLSSADRQVKARTCVCPGRYLENRSRQKAADLTANEPKPCAPHYIRRVLLAIDRHLHLARLHQSLVSAPVQTIRPPSFLLNRVSPHSQERKERKEPPRLVSVNERLDRRRVIETQPRPVSKGIPFSICVYAWEDLGQGPSTLHISVSARAHAVVRIISPVSTKSYNAAKHVVSFTHTFRSFKST